MRDKQIAAKCQASAEKAFAQLASESQGPADLMTAVTIVMAMAHIYLRDNGVDKNIEDTMATLSAAAIHFVAIASERQRNLQ